jgi:hypothetical protein
MAGWYLIGAWLVVRVARIVLRVVVCLTSRAVESRLPAMKTRVPARRPSASTDGIPPGSATTARERVLRALELGRRGQMLRKLGEHARSGRIARAG